METAEEYVNFLINAPINMELNKDTVPEIMVDFTKDKVLEILKRVGLDPLEIYWELEQIV